MSTQRRIVRSPGGTARPTTWANRVSLLTHTAAAQTTFTDLTHVSAAVSNEGATVVRMILQVWLSNAAVTPETESFGLGVMRMSKEALDNLAGPDPFTDAVTDWYYWWSGIIPLFNEPVKVVDVDIHSARKLRGTDRLVMVTRNPTNELALEASVMARTLWKPV